MTQLVVFDWNGTLFADIRPLVGGVNAVLEYLGHPQISVETYRRHYDAPTRRLYIGLGVSNDEIERRGQHMLETFHAFYEPKAARVRTRSGARSLLTALHDIPKVILSNHTMEGIYLQLERLRLTDYFETVLANDNIHRAYAKGKQDRLVNYIQEHQIAPKNVFIIGDTTEEIRIGKALGLKTVAITGGACTTERLEAEGPDYLISRLAEFAAIVKPIRRND